jgi:hypothetical protein
MTASLTNITDLKEYLRLSVSTDDALLSASILSASAWVRSYLNRDITTAEYTELKEGSGTQTLMLGQYPITAVSSVSVDGVSQDLTYITARNGLLIRADGQKWPRGYANVSVTYTAGYVTIPYDIGQATLEICAWRYEESKRIGQSSKSAGGHETVSYQTTDVPPNVKTLLKNWRRVM